MNLLVRKMSNFSEFAICRNAVFTGKSGEKIYKVSLAKRQNALSCDFSLAMIAVHPTVELA